MSAWTRLHSEEKFMSPCFHTRLTEVLTYVTPVVANGFEVKSIVSGIYVIFPRGENLFPPLSGIHVGLQLVI